MSENDGTGENWSIANPEDTDVAGFGAQEIRDLRAGVGIRLSKEHVAPADDSVGGEHKKGSAVVYVQDEEPTTLPDGATALDVNQAGRLWYDSGDGKMYKWDGNNWIPFVAPSSVVNSMVLDATLQAIKMEAGSRVFVGTYTGNGVTGTGSIAGPSVTLGWQPAMVFIFSSNIYFTTGNFYGAGQHVVNVAAGVVATGLGITFSGTGFQITRRGTPPAGVDDLNANASVYTFIAVG